ncbi:MAG: response regulator transcription factor [Solirubrobacterales bacterium]
MRIVVADDHEVVRSAMRALLEAERGLEVEAEAADLAGTLRLASELRPDVLVLDLSLREESSLESIPRILEDSPGTRIVVATMHDDPEVARRALEAGATGFLLKASAASELVDAVRAAADGATHVEPAVQARLEREPQPAGRDGLTPRERQVLGLVALGHTNKEIADSLGLSSRTVESHRIHIQQKLGIQSRAELVRYALDHGLMGR